MVRKRLLLQYLFISICKDYNVVIWGNSYLFLLKYRMLYFLDSGVNTTLFAHRPSYQAVYHKC